jgi:hypothetical protein
VSATPQYGTPQLFDGSDYIPKRDDARFSKVYCGEGLYRYRVDPQSGGPVQLNLGRREQYTGRCVEGSERGARKVGG